MKKPKKHGISDIVRTRNIRLSKLQGEQGFTFVELMVVIAIILVLSATIGIVAIQSIGQAKIATAKTQVQNFSMAFNAYAYRNGRLPSEEQGVAALWQKPSVEPIPKDWGGPFLEKQPDNDPWGNPYKYTVPGPNGLPFGVASFGADGVEGGEGDNADIVSWQ